MSFQILDFRDAGKILKDKHLTNDIEGSMQYIDEMLRGSLYRRELLRQALEDMGWRDGPDSLRILEGRRYAYKGYKKGVAIDGNFSAYEFILEGLFRLQLGYDKGIIETGILLLTSKRSEKSPLGSSVKLAKEEIELLYPTISMPVIIVLFDLGNPELIDE